MDSITHNAVDDNNDITVLLIDDNQVNNKLVASILMPQGYNIYIADSGMSGIKLVKETLPDIILLDIMMPEIDGFQVCRHLQHDSLIREIPIIFITADSSVKTQTKAFQLGGNDFITKPIVDVVLIERIRNQVRLSRNKKKLKTLNNYYRLSEKISNTGFWAYTQNIAGNDFTCSSQFNRLIRFSEREVKENSPDSASVITELLRSSRDPITKKEYADRFEKCMKDGGSFDEICNFRFNSSTAYLRIWARFNKIREDFVTGFGAIQDISQVIKTENELAEIKARIGEISSKQHFVEANTQLAHEINQPLAAINLNINYIKKLLDFSPDNTEKLRDALTDINNDVCRVTQIVKNIRRIVKREPAVFRKFDLYAFLEDTVYIFNREFQQKNIEVIFEHPEEECLVVFDRTGLQQVIVNLLKNAVEAITQAEIKNPQIEISVVKAETEMHIFISDNGPGIPAENREKIFQQYFTSKKGNTGLGLAICKGMMTELEGNIYLIDPPEGRNTCFKLVIPY
ncbi:MAG: hybrid sensor histidine kinase/response regulator [Kiritimatiellia bacterium]